MVNLTANLRRLIPLFDKVLVKKIEAVTKSGIHLPQGSTRQNTGKVIEVGTGLRDRNGSTIPMTVKAGDEVLLPDYGGTKITLDEEEYHLYKESDLLGKFHG